MNKPWMSTSRPYTTLDLRQLSDQNHIQLFSLYRSYVPTQFSKDSNCATMKDFFQTNQCGWNWNKQFLFVIGSVWSIDPDSPFKGQLGVP